MRTLICISVLTLVGGGLSYGFSEVRSKPDVKRETEVVTVRRSVEPELLAKATSFLKSRKVKQKVDANPQLSARTPWIKEGSIDMYLAGRWDAPDNRVSCSAHVVGGGGDWNGTVGYIKFKPPTAGTYIVITRFTGTKKTCHVEGPWGDASATTQVNGDAGEVVGIFSARSTSAVDITFHFTIPYGQGGIGATWFGTEFIKFDP